MMDMTNERLNESLDIIKFIREHRELKILANNSKDFNIMKSFQADHSHKCVMNLESDGESVNSSLTECSDSNASGGENAIID